MAQTVISQPRLARLAIGDLAFQERFQFGQRTLELVGDAHHGAGFLNPRDRSVQNVDLGHFLETLRQRFVPLPPGTRPRRNGDQFSKLASGKSLEGVTMAGRRFKRIEVGTAGIIGMALFLLAWGVVERITGTEPKSAPPGTTLHAANKAGATVTPTDQTVLQR